MADNAWDRSIINALERPLSSDINALQSQEDRSLRDLLARLLGSRVSGSSDVAANPQSGFLGEGFKVRPPVAPGLSVRLAAGLGFQYLPADVPTSIGGVVGVNDLSSYKPLPLLAEASIAGIPAGPAAGQDRYDIVEVRMNRVAGNPLSRNVLDPLTGIFVPTLVNKTLSFTLDGSTGQVTSPSNSTAAISYKVGVPVATGVFNPANIPATTPGYVRVAVIFSKNGNMTAGITRANIIDDRTLLCENGVMSLGVACSVPTGAASPPTSATLTGPSGVEVVVLKNAAPANNQLEVFLIGGAAPVRGSMMGNILRATASTAEYNTLAPYGIPNVDTLSAAQVTDLQNANIAGPALVFSEGQPYFSQKFTGVRMNPGTGVDGAIPDPAIMAFQALIQRY